VITALPTVLAPNTVHCEGASVFERHGAEHYRYQQICTTFGFGVAQHRSSPAKPKRGSNLITMSVLSGALNRLVGPRARLMEDREGLTVERRSTEAGRGSGWPRRYSRGRLE